MKLMPIPLRNLYKRCQQIWSFVCINYPKTERLGFIGKDSKIEYPVFIQTPKTVYIEEHCQVRRGCTIINAPEEKVIIKKYSLLSVNTTIVTQNHVSTVGIPIVMLGPSHINDKRGDIIIEEDVWLGANVTLITGTKLGRGCIVGAGSLVNKEIPPYAVVVGVPAHIIAVKFSREQILKHEKVLYSKEERMTEKQIDDLFQQYYGDMRVYGVTTDLSPYISKLKLWQEGENYLNFDELGF